MFCSNVDWESHDSMNAKLFIRFLGANASLKRHPLENALFWMLPQTLVKRETIHGLFLVVGKGAGGAGLG